MDFSYGNRKSACIFPKKPTSLSHIYHTYIACMSQVYENISRCLQGKAIILAFFVCHFLNWHITLRKSQGTLKKIATHLQAPCEHLELCREWSQCILGMNSYFLKVHSRGPQGGCKKFSLPVWELMRWTEISGRNWARSFLVWNPLQSS